jgi:hypothetical protein
MVIADFNVVCLTILKTKANAPLRIDRNSVLPLPVARKRMEPIARGYLQIIQTLSQMHIFELPSGSLRHVWRELIGSPYGIELLGALNGKSLNHWLKCSASRDMYQQAGPMPA